MDLKGKKLTGYYSIREKLGEDLFAEIWEVKPIFSALELYGFFFKKSVSEFQPASVRGLQAYVRETFNLQHANLVNVFESDTFDGRVFILTEKVQGFRLADYLASKDVFTLGETLSIVFELLTALVYLHGRGLGQNLINPQTVWIAPLLPFQNRIRIACFGYKFGIGEAFLKSEAGYASVAAYLAPEMRRNPEKMVDFQSDLYSVGVLFFRLLTGELPEKVGKEHQPMPVVQAEKVLREKAVPREIRRLVVLLMKIRVAWRARSAEAMTDGVLAAIRRYTFREHGEVDAKAYLNEISRKASETASGEASTWGPRSVFGSRSRETASAEGSLYQARNLYFAKLVEEFMSSKGRGSLEWKENPFLSGDKESESPEQDFVDETQVVPTALLQNRLEPAAAQADEGDLLLLEVAPPDELPDSAPAPVRRSWLQDLWAFVLALFRGGKSRD